MDQAGADFDYRIIFSDIDGTLINNRHQVSQATCRGILRLEEMGVPFVLVSARMPDGILPIRDQIGNRAPIVSYSGGLVQAADGTVLESFQMELGTALQIKELLEREFPSVCCNTYGFHKWVVDDETDPRVVNEERITGLKAVGADIREAFAEDGGMHKFLLMGAETVIPVVRDRLKQRFPELSVAASSPVYLEVMDGRVKKSGGLRFLCGHYGIPVEQSLAFGDGDVDLDMLLAAGRGYAMANASEYVRKNARFFTLDNEHDGVLAVLKEVYMI